MRVAAVIPTYNRGHCIGRAIESVLLQTSPVDEVIVVDDGSTDGTASYISEHYPGVNLIACQQNQGVSAARNQGIMATECDWIALLDSDDSWLPHKMEAVRAAHRQQPEFHLYHSEEIWIRNGVRVNAMNKHRKSGGWIFPNCLPLCAISPSAAVIDRQLLIDLGLFNEQLPACEDYDMWLKLCHRYPVAFIDQPLITKYGGHEDQLSRAHIAMDRFRIEAIEDLLKQDHLTSEYRALAIKTLRSKLDILIRGARKHGNQDLIRRFSPLQEKWRDQALC